MTIIQEMLNSMKLNVDTNTAEGSSKYSSRDSSGFLNVLESANKSYNFSFEKKYNDNTSSNNDFYKKDLYSSDRNSQYGEFKSDYGKFQNEMIYKEKGSDFDITTISCYGPNAPTGPLAKPPEEPLTGITKVVCYGPETPSAKEPEAKSPEEPLAGITKVVCYGPETPSEKKSEPTAESKSVNAETKEEPLVATKKGTQPEETASVLNKLGELNEAPKTQQENKAPLILEEKVQATKQEISNTLEIQKTDDNQKTEDKLLKENLSLLNTVIQPKNPVAEVASNNLHSPEKAAHGKAVSLLAKENNNAEPKALQLKQQLQGQNQQAETEPNKETKEIPEQLANKKAAPKTMPAVAQQANNTDSKEAPNKPALQPATLNKEAGNGKIQLETQKVEQNIQQEVAKVSVAKSKTTTVQNTQVEHLKPMSEKLSEDNAKAVVLNAESKTDTKNADLKQNQQNNQQELKNKLNLNQAVLGENSSQKISKNIQFDKILQSKQPSTTQTSVMDQVLKKVSSSFGSDKSQISIALNPERLGNVTLNLITQKGVLTAQVVAESSQVKNMLTKGLESLRQSLTEQGVNVGKIVVQVQEPASSHSNNNS